MNSSIKLKLKEIAFEFSLDLFVLFGSRANNSYNKDSDWDLAFYSINDLDYINRKELFVKISNILKTENIDLIDLKKSDNIVLNYEIFKNGLLIYESKNGLFEKFETDSWFNFQFHRDLINMANKNLKNELHNI